MSWLVVTELIDRTGMVLAGAQKRTLTLINSEPPTDLASTSLSLSTSLSYATTMADSNARSMCLMLRTSEEAALTE
jgi:hypothetical protein